MKIITILSNHTGSGQTTVAVNLAVGLIRQGCRVLIGGLGETNKLHDWLGISSAHDHSEALYASEVFRDKILWSSRQGLEWLELADHSCAALLCNPFLHKLKYDYLLLNPTSKEYCGLLTQISDAVMVCTDLSHDNEFEELKALEQYLQDAGGKAKTFSLILPNKIDTKEWEHNTNQLFALADYFGYEKIADPIPG